MAEAAAEAASEAWRDAAIQMDTTRLPRPAASQ